ncbi:MAG: carotenoid biosynthesis protein [Daejeonella sp.]|uniref:carotenoid biosynthesis protein n=1 Tax=Daejeonella sp. TaxID=2805397 RepID=UPI002733B47B|nr:carotenoid biosynthesis protein [Daejeonella sp.]MDP3469159.1 carotenoid biosynthesis protein [Daejeonella sp.]
MSRIILCSVIIVLFHLVGLYGFLTPAFEELFIKLVPFHLLLMLLLMILTVNDKSNDLIKFAIVIYLAGFFIEVIGVNTGWIFGNYTYGTALGAKLWATPLLIGVNWLILVYCTGVFLHYFNLKSKLIFSALGAGILLGMDFLIEPVAIRFDYWSWYGGIIPIQNYLGWYIFSFILFLFFSGLNFRKKNNAAIVLLFAQFGFFLILNLWAF